MLFDGDFTLTDQIVDNHECKRENLIGMMQDVQEHYKYLPPEVLVHLAGLTSLGVAYLAPFSDVRGWRAVLRPRLSQQKFRDPALGAVDRKNQK